MRHLIPLLSCVFLLQSLVSCKSYSRYAIDNKATVKKDSSLLGIWKIEEDSDKANFILVQSCYDLLSQSKKWLDMSPAEKRVAILKADSNINRGFLESTILPSHEDTVMYEEECAKCLKQQDYYYYLTYFNGHGKGPEYEQWEAFPSTINNMKFINVSYRYEPYINDTLVTGQEEEGYFFVRIININPTYDTITTAIVADTTLKYLPNATEVRKLIERKGKMASFYSDTVHLYKVSGYHLSMGKSVEIANP
jgi:hypothetical protein